MSAILEFLQQNAAIFSVLTALGTVLGLAFTVYVASHKKQIETLQQQLKESTGGDAKALKKLSEELLEQRNQANIHVM